MSSFDDLYSECDQEDCPFSPADVPAIVLFSLDGKRTPTIHCLYCYLVHVKGLDATAAIEITESY